MGASIPCTCLLWRKLHCTLMWSRSQTHRNGRGASAANVRLHHLLRLEPCAWYQEAACAHVLSHKRCYFADITEITGKTGNFKPYPVFIKMLVSSLKRTSDSVSIDLLTYSDLEVLKAKRLRRSGHDVPLPANTVVNNKRYLILTYQGEFDKVHYPLPLPFEEHPDPADLKKTIIRLRGAVPEMTDAVAACLAE